MQAEETRSDSGMCGNVDILTPSSPPQKQVSTNSLIAALRKRSYHEVLNNDE
jgi:hypothetical protein